MDKCFSLYELWDVFLWIIVRPDVTEKLRMREEDGRIFQDDGAKVCFDGSWNVWRQERSISIHEDKAGSDLQKSKQVWPHRNDRKIDKLIQAGLKVFVQVKPKSFDPFPAWLLFKLIRNPIRSKLTKLVKEVSNNFLN